ncbi:MAG: monovalent cation/H(+) antiporter subunit G [Defluviitaleaceae bacterium]|nr:monovalent cation/H(+) antiporter subunit G [Defluviitaleaceae bacterium]
MSIVLEVVGMALMALGLVVMLIGIIGIFRFKNFYARILVVSKVDTVGVLIFLIGLAIRHGFSFFSGKLLLLMVIILILSPLVGHMIARSAYASGLKLTDPHKADDKNEGDGL